MAGAFALQPQLLPRAAVEGGEAGLDGFAKGFFIHEADHEDAAGGVVLNDRGDQAVDFCEIQIHMLTAIKKPAGTAAGVLSDSDLMANQETARRVQA